MNSFKLDKGVAIVMLSLVGLVPLGILTQPGEHVVAASMVVVVATLLGGGLVGLGFADLRGRWTLENLPRSRMGSVAVGLAEVVGKVRGRRLVTSPMGKTRCVFYSGIAQSQEPFYIEDRTGTLLVDPRGAEAVLRARRSENGSLEPVLLSGHWACVTGTVRRASELDESLRHELVWPQDPSDLLVITKGTTEQTLVITDRQELSISEEMRGRALVLITMGSGILFLQMVYFVIKWITR